LVFGKEQGLHTQVLDHKTYADREAFDAALAEVIDRYDTPQAPVLVVLAGFMRILTAGFVEQYAGRLVEHPPLAVAGFWRLEHAPAGAGCRLQICRCHRAPGDAELDHGPILEQAVVPVLPSDTADALAARVLTQEHRIYPLGGCDAAAIKKQLPAHIPFALEALFMLKR